MDDCNKGQGNGLDSEAALNKEYTAERFGFLNTVA